VSLQPYGVFNHRHHPEITTHLGAEVIFTPHLGSFPRGILETITCRLKPGVTKEQVNEVFSRRMRINRWCVCTIKACRR
jgi:N-acetyl-gamma-glutamyl-phosphate reductase